MSIFFAPVNTAPGDSIHYSSLERKSYSHANPAYACTLMIATIDLACFGDYDNSCAVEQSNYRVMLADEEIAPHLVKLIGSHGSTGLAYIVPDPEHPGDIHALPEALRDALAALDNYPLLSDDDHSELESELESEAWDDHGRSDFVKALVKLLDEVESSTPHSAECLAHPDGANGPECICDATEEIHESDYLDDNHPIVDALWRAGCDAYGVNGGSGFQVKAGCGVYFYIGEWVKRAAREPDLASQHAARYHMSDVVVPTLAELAVKCRVA